MIFLLKNWFQNQALYQHIFHVFQGFCFLTYVFEDFIQMYLFCRILRWGSQVPLSFHRIGRHTCCSDCRRCSIWIKSNQSKDSPQSYSVLLLCLLAYTPRDHIHPISYLEEHHQVVPRSLQIVGVQVAIQVVVGVLHLPFDLAEHRKNLLFLFQSVSQIMLKFIILMKEWEPRLELQAPIKLTIFYTSHVSVN